MATLSTLTSLQSVCGCKLVSAPRSRISKRGALVQVRAGEDNKPKKIDFQPNKRAGVGFIDDDSAGQTNIFAVEPKRYVAGSQQDQTGSSNLAIGIGAGLLGGLILLAGVLGGKGGVDSSTPADEGLLSLTEYSQQFSREK